MELGISTFGEVEPERGSGGALKSHRRMQELLIEARLADEIGLQVVAIGEHHRPDFIVSVPEVVLGAVAATGRPEEVAEKIVYEHRILGQTRFLGQMIKGEGLSHEKVLRGIELLGTSVAAQLREKLAG